MIYNGSRADRGDFVPEFFPLERTNLGKTNAQSPQNAAMSFARCYMQL
jgi:hypothetical protein